MSSRRKYGNSCKSDAQQWIDLSERERQEPVILSPSPERRKARERPSFTQQEEERRMKEDMRKALLRKAEEQQAAQQVPGLPPPSEWQRRFMKIDPCVNLTKESFYTSMK